MNASDRAFVAPGYTTRACESCGQSFQPYAVDMRRCGPCREALQVHRKCAAHGCDRGVLAFHHKYCSRGCAQLARNQKARARYAKRGAAILAAGITCGDCGEQLRSSKGAASGRCRICLWKATQRKTVEIRKGRPTQSRFAITCRHCGQRAEKGQPYAKYCSTECRSKAGWKREKARIAEEFIATLRGER